MFSYGDRVQPTRDWLILSGIAIGLLILSVIGNVFIFNQLESGKSLVATSTPPAPNTAGSVAAAQHLFQLRATEENHYQSDYHFVDPSLPGS